MPHGAVRGFVMGERGARNEPATADDIEAMAAIVRDGIAAGALGFSTSRTLAHRAIDGEPVPGTFAAEDELFGIGRVLGELGTAVFELAPAGALGEDLAAPEKEMDWMRRLSAAIGRPVTFALNQNNNDPDGLADACSTSPSAAAAEGAESVRRCTAARCRCCSGCRRSIRSTSARRGRAIGLLPWREQAARMRDRPRRSRSARRQRRRRSRAIRSCRASCTRRGSSCSATRRTTSRRRRAASPASPRPKAARNGRRLYDLLLADGGRELLNAPVLNYTDGNLDAAREMLMHPTSAFGLGDGGAHAGQTCDASTTTYLLSYWARDRDARSHPARDSRCTSSPARPRRCSVSAIAACSRRA